MANEPRFSIAAFYGALFVCECAAVAAFVALHWQRARIERLAPLCVDVRITDVAESKRLVDRDTTTSDYSSSRIERRWRSPLSCDVAQLIGLALLGIEISTIIPSLATFATLPFSQVFDQKFSSAWTVSRSEKSQNTSFGANRKNRLIRQFFYSNCRISGSIFLVADVERFDSAVRRVRRLLYSRSTRPLSGRAVGAQFGRNTRLYAHRSVVSKSLACANDNRRRFRGQWRQVETTISICWRFQVVLTVIIMGLGCFLRIALLEAYRDAQTADETRIFRGGLCLQARRSGGRVKAAILILRSARLSARSSCIQSSTLRTFFTTRLNAEAANTTTICT